MLKQKKRQFCLIAFLVLLVILFYLTKPAKWKNHDLNTDNNTHQITKCFQELPQDKVYFSSQIVCPLETKKDDLPWQISSLKNSLMNACQPHSEECVQIIEDEIKNQEGLEYHSTIMMRNSLNFGEPQLIKFQQTANENIFRELLTEYCLDKISKNTTPTTHNNHSSIYKQILNGGIEAESSIRYILKNQTGDTLGEISRGEEFDIRDYERVDIHLERSNGNTTSKFFPFFNYHKDQAILDRVQRRIKRIVNEETKKGLLLSENQEKMNVVLILNDALSHLRYVRLFSIFREWLDKKVNAGQIEYFTFRRYHVTGWYSPENQIPLYIGRDLNFMNGHYHCGDVDGPVEDKDCDRILWNKYREEGYLTIDSRDRYDGRYMQKCHAKHAKGCKKEDEWGGLYADIVIPKKSFKGFSFVESFTTLTWLEQVLKEHTGDYPIFATATNLNFHSLPHKLSTSIWDIMSFLENVDFENTIIILHSDHGFHYTSHAYNEAGYNEHKYPQLLFIMPKQLLDKKPWIRQNLQNNANRLLSHYDLYTTLREFPQMQSDFFQNQFKEQGDGSSHRAYSHFVENTYNLFTETIPKDRTCEEANIDPGLCLCVEWEKSYSILMKWQAISYAKRSVKLINEKTLIEGSNCQPLKYVRIENLEQTLNKKQMRYHLMGKVKGKAELIRFQIFWSNKRKHRIYTPIRMSKMSEAEINNTLPEDLKIDPHICFLKDEE
ncbi:hypothetical protein M0813_16206 [Anaeramoeba flamelloides]|uniref:Uncharacterized protein n=1 Tax=Anaeramoeba flamelloides TaxID=1746091 RepID=A0ABQ8Z025_9EUKA|nr:hypothetical protein M0813_16206 [Anaeramoeba flamelloides]